MRAEVVLHEMDSFCPWKSACNPLQGFHVVAGTPVRRSVGQVDPQLWSDNGKHVGGSHTFVLLIHMGASTWLNWRRWAFCAPATAQAFRQGKRPALVSSTVPSTTSTRLPSGRRTRRLISVRTTFFSRHGLRSWASNTFC